MRFALALAFAAFGCDGPSEGDDGESDFVRGDVFGGDLVASSECPSLPESERGACSGSGPLYLASIRIGVAPGVTSEVAQTFVAETAAAPIGARLRLRLLRRLAPAIDPVLHVDVRPAPGGVVSTDPGTALARGTLHVTDLQANTGEREVSLSAVGGGGALELGATYAVVIWSNSPVSMPFLVGVAVHTTDLYPSGVAAIRRVRGTAAAVFRPVPSGLDLLFGVRSPGAAVDECALGTHECDAHGTCVDEASGYACACDAGYESLGHACVDVDECAANVASCATHSSCVNEEGGYTCPCDAGYADVDGTCANVDECAAGTDSCPAHSGCVDTEGAWACECKEGYEASGDTCVNVNECEAATWPCPNHSECTDLPGTFSCTCLAGFDGPACADVDECEAPGTCAAWQRCENTKGGYDCIDEDECAAGTHDCDLLATCIDEPGGFDCVCPAGFDGDGRTCVDVDECALGTATCPTQSTCVNQNGGYGCACDPGYESANEGHTCKDVDECERGLAACDPGEECQNLSGTYSCVTAASCVALAPSCDPHAVCNLGPAGAYCECRRGWQGNGLSCTNVDECALGRCPAHSACTDLAGGYECECDAGYVSLDAGATCVDVDECEAEPCAIGFHCVNTAGSHECVSDGECGNGIVEGYEVCDDGAELMTENPQPGGCRLGCVSYWCGDGIVDPGEQCDDGVDNSRSLAGACRPDCRAARCGDGVVDPGEACDTGLKNTQLSAGCRPDCQPARCGDGAIGPGEECDDGTRNSDGKVGACRTDCRVAHCGDGVVDPGEECDEGATNGNTADHCRVSCRLPSCGDGVQDRGEECDAGGANKDAVSNACRTTCRVPRCGDGVVDPFEECDDGNKSNTDACLATCALADGTLAPNPNACVTPSLTFCNAFQGATTLSALDALVNPNPFTADPRRSSITCAHWYARACNDCPPLTVASCTDEPPATSHPICTSLWDQLCAGTLASSCPVATLSACQNSAFRSQSPLVAGSKPHCKAYIGEQCEALLTSQCPATTLDACASYDANPALVPSSCAPWITTSCRQRKLDQCGTGSVAYCAAVEAGTVTPHAACSALVAENCRAWESRFCPALALLTPTVTRCLDPDQNDNLHVGLDARCVAWLDDTCENLVGAQAQQTFASGGGCESRTVRPSAGDPLGFDVVGSVSIPSRFDCTPAKTVEVHPDLVPFTVPAPSEQAAINASFADLLTQIGSDELTSCVDYANSRFWNHAAFKAYTRPFQEDARRVFQLAYSTDPEHDQYAIGTRGLRSGPLHFGFFPVSAGNQLSDFGVDYALTSRGQDTAAPKNDFHALLLPSNSGTLTALLDVSSAREPNPFLRQQRNLRNARIVSRLRDTEFFWDKGTGFNPKDGWHWHREMSQRLANQGHGDEELLYLHDRRTRFLEMLALTRAVRDQLAVAQLNPNAAPLAVVNLSTRLGVLADELEALLVDADGRQCFQRVFDENGELEPAACDWSPRDFVEEVDEVFARQRTRRLAVCQKLAPSDFSTLDGGYTYLVPGSGTPQWVTIGQTPTATVWQFDTYLERREQTLDLLARAFGNLDERRRPLWSQRWGNTEEFGDREWFSAGYAYTAGWLVDVPADREGLCGLNASGDASLNVFTYLRHDRGDLLDAGLAADVRADLFETHFEVLGVDVWNEAYDTTQGPAIPSLNYEFNVVYESEAATYEDGFEVEAPVFSIAGIDVVLRAGVSGKLGVDVGGGVRLSVANVNDCGPGFDAGLVGRVKPYVRIDGFLEAGLDLLIVELGVGGSLNVITAALPVDLAVGVKTPGLLAAPRADFAVDADAHLAVSTLSGQLYVYADTFWKTYKKTFFTWNGLAWDVPILDKHYEHELGAVWDYCRLPGVSCE